MPSRSHQVLPCLVQGFPGPSKAKSDRMIVRVDTHRVAKHEVSETFKNEEDETVTEISRLEAEPSTQEHDSGPGRRKGVGRGKLCA